MIHEHLKSLKCPNCGKRTKILKRKGHLVGCMEYEIFICDNFKDKANGSREFCTTLIINYPHDSAQKENKIIEL